METISTSLAAGGPAQTAAATPPLRVLAEAGATVAAPAAPRALTAQFDYPVTLQGSTQYFTVYYDPSLGGDGSTIAAAVLQTCEQDYARVSAWFGGINVGPMNVIIASGINGAYHYGCTGTDIYCGSRTGPVDVNYTRYVLMAEVVEVFSAVQAVGWNCAGSNGEGLSRVLATELYPSELSGFATAAKWLDGGRPDWINQTEGTDRDSVSTGCATLFLNWLHYELGYSWRQIVGAGAPTLAGTYANLTSRPDAFLAQVQARFPAGTASGLGGDNAFPLWSQFAEFTLGDQSYMWAYDPSTGLVAIEEVNGSGAGFTETYSGIWDTGFTSFTAVELGGQAYVWAYRASDGRVCIHQINAGGAGFTQTAYIAVWDTGYTSFAPIQLDGLAFVWAYRQSDGRVCIHRINTGGTGFTQTAYIAVWDSGYTSFAPIQLDGLAYIWAYRQSDGRVCIHQIDVGGTGFTQTGYIPVWDSGYTGFAPIQLGGLPYIWAYRQSDGRVCIHQINSGGTGFTQTGYIPVWDTGYTAFQGIELAGQAYIWAYRASNGWVCIHQINAGGTGFTQVYISVAD